MKIHKPVAALRKLVFMLGLAILVPFPTQATPIDRDAVVGAWRLVRIDFTQDGKPAKDPNFAANPSGLIIYDRSGWMSVQIATTPRPAMIEKPRTSGINSPADAMTKAAAMDSYYAYYGRWTFDAEKSVMHHQTAVSLLPFETGTERQRDAKFDGHFLSLIVHAPSGQNWIRTLVWERQP